MKAKVQTVIGIGARALLRRVSSARRRRKPVVPKRILIAQDLRLGDTILITPLLAKLRAQYPAAELVMTARKEFAPLYEKCGFDVDIWPFDSQDSRTVAAMPKGGFDLAIVPGDNISSWLATALGARWIVAHRDDGPIFKNWPIDEFHDYPSKPTALGEIFVGLVPGPAPRPYDVSDWPAPNFRAFGQPLSPYVVLHPGASKFQKLWPAERWRALAEWLTAQALGVVWSGGDGEAAIVAEIDPDRRFTSYAGQLDLPQLWRLIANAHLMVSPDTGVAHLARLTGTPTVTLFGPASRVLFGAGEFWRNSPCSEVTIEDFPCRDQHRVFRREVEWLNRCRRGSEECPVPRCMSAIDTARVINIASSLLAEKFATIHRDLAETIPAHQLRFSGSGSRFMCHGDTAVYDRSRLPSAPF